MARLKLTRGRVRVARALTFAVLCLCTIAPAGAIANEPPRLSAQLQQATGYSPGQLQSRPACGDVAPGRISCRAEVLTVRRSGRPVSLLARRSVGEPAEDHPSDAGESAPSLFTPAYLQWGYDLGWLSANKGAGDTIAIVDAYDDPDANADLGQFRQEFGLYPCASTASAAACRTAIDDDGLFEQYNQSGQPIDDPGSGTAPPAAGDSGWDIEESLDVDSVSAICPQCTIDLVEAQSDEYDSDFEAAYSAAEGLGADQISMSWGSDDNEGCEGGDYWSAGVSSLAAAGDEGYQGASHTVTHCRSDPTSNTVDYPAAESEVTAVGGTALAEANNTRGFTESVWNDGYVSDADQYYATESGCDTSQTVPGYQQSVATFDGCAGRAYNDVSADADPDTGLDIYDSYDGGCGSSGQSTDDWCVVGGTSLATPLTAAYEALVGITPTDSPAWAYSDASALNDVTTGDDIDSDEPDPIPCSLDFICEAETGWDGPTGNGSISGDLATGAPQIGGAYATSTTLSGADTASASLAGGVYPNEGTTTDTTTYQWDYGTTASYEAGSISGTSTLSGSALSPVTGTITGLAPCTTYHFRLEATNADGTGFGYDNTFVTPLAAEPVDTTPPAITGTTAVGAVLSGQVGDWTEPACDTPSYEWLESTSQNGGYTDVSGATASTYALTDADLGDYLELSVIETDADGPGSAVTSQPIGPITAASSTQTGGSSGSPAATTPPVNPGSQTSSAPSTSASPRVISAPTITGATQVGGTITVGGGSFTDATGTVIQIYRCAHSCTLLSTGPAASYRLRAPDAGHFIEVKVTVYGAAGTKPVTTVSWTGPITSARAGARRISSGAITASASKVTGTTGAPLAAERIIERSGQTLKLAVSPATHQRTAAWACVVSGAAPVSCTTARSLDGRTTFTVRLERGESLELIAVRS